MHQGGFTDRASYRGKTALVIGAARSGTAAAELLLSLGARVILSDLKPREALGELPEALNSPECTLSFGRTPDTHFASCDFVVISPGIPLSSPVLAPARERGLPVFGEMAFAASCWDGSLVAVSGTNGKTTTVSLLGEIFTQAGRITHVAGNIGYPLSAAVIRAKEDDLLVAEVSSFQLETVGGFHPRSAALLNITPDHLDRHGSMKAYEDLKLSLFSNMGPQDQAVLNMDDPTVRAMAPEIKADIRWFSSSGEVPEGAMLTDGWIVLKSRGETRKVCEVSALKIPGRHNVENALAAAATAFGMGVPAPVIAYALKGFKGVEHRIEYVTEIRGVRFLNDSKGTNPDSTIKAVESMKAPTILIAGGYDKDVPFDTLAKSVISSGSIRGAVLTGATRDKIRNALTEAGFAAIVTAPDLKQAVISAMYMAEPGYNVLFSPACASFDMFRDYEERGRVFKQLVLELKQGEE